MRYVVIMAGGSGTRLWPLSRQGTPKQFLEIFDGRSLLQMAYERALGVVPAEQILTCTSRDYADVVAAQLPDLPAANILGEPVGRDSLGAVAWSAAVLAERDPDAVVAMVTADHIISPVPEFQHCLLTALELAESRSESLITLGVVPDLPHTGYGYLQRAEPLEGFEEAVRVAQFKEKPDAETAQAYLDSGQYWWNSGIFVWRAETLLRQLDQLHPDYAASIRDIAAHPDHLDDAFPRLEKMSVDYGVMEPVSQGRTAAEIFAVGLSVSWRDVGGYVALAEEFVTDENGNRVDGRTITLDSDGCIVVNTRPEDHLVACLGLSDTLVVHTEGATLAASLNDVERIKALVELVRTTHGAEFS